jgi:hypothetical protein
LLAQPHAEFLDPLFELADGRGHGLLVAGGFEGLPVFPHPEPDSARANERRYSQWHTTVNLHSVFASKRGATRVTERNQMIITKASAKPNRKTTSTTSRKYIAYRGLRVKALVC